MKITFNRINFIGFLFAFFVSFTLLSQSIPSDLNSLDDKEILGYWQQAQAQGYTLAQVKALALARGVSPSKIAELEGKLSGMSASPGSMSDSQIDTSLDIVKGDLEGFTGSEVKKEIKDPLFGYDFFNNVNITFTPNINLATPANYQLGPGDELVISIWGAAENTYNLSVNREGSIRLNGIAPIYVNGLSIEEATKKIKGALSRIYAGVNERENSPYKVFVGVSLVNVRTVQVDIIGEVKVPGTYSLSALSSVLNALYASGGPTKQGTFRDIRLIRNGKEVASFDVYDYLINGSQEGNKNLRDQDVIIVSPYKSRVQVSGGVKRPGIYEILPSENLNDLLTYVSGFKSNAYRDRIVLERIEGDRMVVKELLTKNALAEGLKDGDNLIVKNIIDKFENRIEIEGAVYRPGKYELTEGLTLKGLIEKSAGLTELAFSTRALLFRTDDNIKQTVVPFSVTSVMNGEKDIVLKPNDRVRIFNKYNLEEQGFLTISGAVNSPDKFPYMENMTIEDLILLGGGLKKEANSSVIDIYRKITDDNYETLTESFKIAANGKLTLDSGDSFQLQPNDRVSVRYLMGVYESVNVSVNGEVSYPGAYSIETKDEKISDLVMKAGGISPYAFVKGATLIRKNPYHKEMLQNTTVAFLSEKEGSGSESIDLNNRASFRVGIDLEKILKDPNSKHNLVLKNGDILDIPSVMQTVKVDGEVLVPSLVRFDKSFTLKDYINRSGGFSSNAKKGKAYVIYSNGDIAATKHFLFFRNYPKLEPGAAVIIPTKPERKDGLNTQEVIGLTTGLATLGLLINSIIK
ncbi:SLBB domain-containing protein [Ulvibacter litoralis]|uniref:Protein involved in polysaccharide export, contains SLBB domain of the beta-grasp fold n=1 Tax=Ulvibacter litoralis TaxID=227084 RepID=A0A1G7HM69_9FLAO|nr:SLBB domain-containing protein [Ulvibacter litoralis]GHC58332.1 capsule polysaccharide transporter [Ulvibacter litoralis]SDF01453.1 protein involved in polysaccharide export, contains SLBB domain of the beta-grasp fold [Ulvibacter litoralis]